MYFTVWNTGMTKKSRGKKRIRINVYRPKIAPAKNKKPKPTKEQLMDPEFSDEDVLTSLGFDDGGYIIPLPKKSLMLINLPDSFRDELQTMHVSFYLREVGKLMFGWGQICSSE